VTNQGIFYFAMIVFTLMMIGLGLTIMEFRASMADMRAAPGPTDPENAEPPET
jgi:hypothetical protein